VSAARLATWAAARSGTARPSPSPHAQVPARGVKEARKGDGKEERSAGEGDEVAWWGQRAATHLLLCTWLPRLPGAPSRGATLLGYVRTQSRVCVGPGTRALRR